MVPSKRFALVMLALLMLTAVAFTGCTSSSDDGTEPKTPTGGEPASTAEPGPIKIGTLATVDSLPLWVAEDEGLFTAQGIPSVEIVIFQAAQEREAALAAGAVDAIMCDILNASSLEAGGSPMKISTLMLGADTTQGRFAIVAAPKSNIASLADLKGVPVGTASGTITEYVLDKLMDEAGVAAADVKKEEVKKMPVRFQLLMEGKLKAAVLPEPFVTLALQGGATIPEGGDDTKAKQNVSQTILATSEKFLGTDEGVATEAAVLRAWDAAVEKINADPDAYRQTLVDKARLPQPIASTFEVDTYPLAQLPSEDDVQKVLDWMTAKGYLKSEITPGDLLGEKS